MKKQFVISVFCSLFTFISFAQQKIQETIYFKSNSFELSNESFHKLDSIIQLTEYYDFYISLKGHTDNIGSEEFNLKLSENRVLAVKGYFESNSIPPKTIQVEKFGESTPTATNESEKNRALNRRVEILITLKPWPQAVELVKEDKNSWPPIDGIIVQYDKTTYQIPGDKIGNTIDIQVVANTAQMDHLNFTTITTEDELLTSNLMFCIKLSGNSNDCTPKKPFNVYIPVNPKSLCQPRDAFEYNAIKDSVTGRITWKLIPSTFTLEIHNSTTYFVFTVTNLCDPCKNFDCKAPKPQSEIKLILKSNRFEIRKASSIYQEANALFPGIYEKRNQYIIHLFQAPTNEIPFINVNGKSKNDKYFRITTLLNELKKDNNGYYIIKKKMIRKSKPRKLTDEEKKSRLENPGISSESGKE